MKIDVLTLFPEMFVGPLDFSMVKRARDLGILDLRVTNLRDYTGDRHKTVDDKPFGGGPGMLLKPEPIFAAVENLAGAKTRVVLLTPAGRKFDQPAARELSLEEHLLFLCGAYEGFDERVRALARDEFSIGDFVLTNGALPAMVMIDAITRLLPGVLGDEQSAQDESFGAAAELEYPHYTRPAEFRGMKVPDVLLSGNHAEIEKWRRAQAKSRTRERRPDLLG